MADARPRVRRRVTPGRILTMIDVDCHEPAPTVAELARRLKISVKALAEPLARLAEAGIVAGWADDSGALRVARVSAGEEVEKIAAVDGPAVGIGTTLLLHADDALATTRAKFALPFVNLGLVPEAGSSILLPQAAGLRRASRLLLCGEPFDAKTALDAGLINEIVEPEQLQSASLARAQIYASRPPQALLASKKLLRDPLREQVNATIKLEAKQFAERLQGPEAKAALSAFVNKKR